MAVLDKKFETFMFGRGLGGDLRNDISNDLGGGPGASGSALLPHPKPEQQAFVSKVTLLLRGMVARKADSSAAQTACELSTLVTQAHQFGHRGLYRELARLQELQVAGAGQDVTCDSATEAQSAVVRRCAELLVRIYVLGDEGPAGIFSSRFTQLASGGDR